MKTIKALLLTAPGCPHCGSVKQALEKIQSGGIPLSVETVDISQQPEVAEQYGVRSVPWLQLGMFELAGAWSLTELRHWAELATSESGMLEYVAEMLSSGQLATAERVLRRYPEQFSVLLQLLVDNERDINVHIGISALIEGMQAEEILVNHLQALAELCRHPEPRVRADACHYLMLTGDARAQEYLRELINDKDEQVREIARESLEELMQGIQ